MTVSVIKKEKEGYPIDCGSSVYGQVNFDTYLTPGVYSFTSSDGVAASTGAPCDSAGKLCVWSLDGQVVSGQFKYGLQEFTTIDGAKYVRNLDTDINSQLTIHAWRRVCDITPATLTEFNTIAFYSSVWSALVIPTNLPYESLSITTVKVWIPGTGWSNKCTIGAAANTTPFSWILATPPSGVTLTDSAMYVVAIWGTTK